MSATPPTGAANATAIVVVLGPLLAFPAFCSLLFWRIVVDDGVASVALAKVAGLKPLEKGVVGTASELWTWEIESEKDDDGSVDMAPGSEAVVPTDEICDEMESRRVVVADGIIIAVFEVDDVVP